MSLINDALKQARQNPTSKPGTAPTPLQPSGTRRRAGRSIFLVPLILVLVAAGSWCWLKWWEGQLTDRRVSQPVQIAARTKTKLASESSPTLTNPPEPMTLAIIPLAGSGVSNRPPAVAANDTNVVAASPVVSTTASGPTNLVIAPPATFPVLKLQGIFYSATRPSAFINNQAVFVGEKILQARVIAIGRQGVTVFWNGQTKMLNLEQDR